MYHTLLLLNFITLGLLVGGLCFANIAVVPTFIKLDTNHYAEFHHILDHYSDPYMPILTFSTALLAIGVLFFSNSPWQVVSRLIGIACIVGVALISIFIHGPLNKRIRMWRPDVKMEHLAEIRLKWVVGHRIRTVIAFIGLVALLLPVVLSS